MKPRVSTAGMRMFVKGDASTTVEHMLDHIDHVVKLTGVEHVGIGSDMEVKVRESNDDRVTFGKTGTTRD